MDEIEKWLSRVLVPTSINFVRSGSDVAKIATADITILTYGLLYSVRCPFPFFGGRNAPAFDGRENVSGCQARGRVDHDRSKARFESLMLYQYAAAD